MFHGRGGSVARIPSFAYTTRINVHPSNTVLQPESTLTNRDMTKKRTRRVSEQTSPTEDLRDARARSRRENADEAAKKAEAVAAKKANAKKKKAAVRPLPPEASGRTWRAGGF